VSKSPAAESFLFLSALNSLGLMSPEELVLEKDISAQVSKTEKSGESSFGGTDIGQNFITTTAGAGTLIGCGKSKNMLHKTFYNYSLHNEVN